MTQEIYPYQYNEIKRQVYNLLNTYHSVNDLNIVKNIQAETEVLIENRFTHIDDTLRNHIQSLMDLKLSKKQCENVLAHIKTYVIPFDAPPLKQLQKTFKKVKKLKIPVVTPEVLQENTYIGWNELSSQRKYIIYYDDNHQLHGFYGDLSPQTVKGFCSICNQDSDVSLFLNKSKTGSDGRYTKKGDYICRDSIKCNSKLYDLNHFNLLLISCFNALTPA